MADNAPPVNDGKTFWRKSVTFITLYWKSIILVIWPLLTLPLLLKYWKYKAARCGYVIGIMAVYWLSSVLPMSVTAMIPIALYPPMGILSTEETCRCYINDTIFMFVGGLVLALAVEHSNLHMRVALKVMTLVGCSHKKLMAGLLIVTTFMSMWISNTAATAMIMPIVFAVLTELEKEGIGKVYTVTDTAGESVREASVVTRGYLLAAAYAATFGGTATFVGTGTNLTFRGLFEGKFHKYGSLSFVQWTIMALPQAYLNAFLTWLYVQVAYFGMFRPNSDRAKESRIGPEGEAIAKRVMAEKYTLLGKMSFHERAVSILFVLCVLLWLTRNPGFTDGWHKLMRPSKPVSYNDTTNSTNTTQHGSGDRKIEKDYILDSTPAMLITILMFIIPKEPQFLHSCSNDANKRPVKASEGLITWDMLQKKIPWGMVFLLGGGFAISTGGNKSGLAASVGKSLLSLQVFSPFVIMCLICIFVSFVTEFTSNVGIANLIIPVISEMSIHLKLNPLYLLLPATIMCSYAFRLPVGTPPNALITLHGEMPVKYLIVGGCVPSIYGLITVIISSATWGVFVYKIDLNAGLPPWANSTVL